MLLIEWRCDGMGWDGIGFNGTMGSVCDRWQSTAMDGWMDG